MVCCPEDHLWHLCAAICDAELVDKLVSEHDAVVHYAAGVSQRQLPLQNLRLFLDTNIVGTVPRPQHGKRLHHVSTDEVYGGRTDDPAKFNSRPLYNLQFLYFPPKPVQTHLHGPRAAPLYLTARTIMDLTTSRSYSAACSKSSKAANHDSGGTGENATDLTPKITARASWPYRERQRLAKPT